MFGFLRPCRHHLPPELHARWSEHLCALCLTLRDEAGQLARTTTHVDALVVSVLAEAQGIGGRRRAGPCPLRGMRPAPVVVGDGARLAASTALLLASDAVSDHVADGDGAFARRPVARAGARVAGAWSRAGTTTASGIGFDPVDLLAVPARQREAEAEASATVAGATAPTEAAVGSALAHTAVLAGRPENVAPLDEAGRLVGRLAHLLDAVADLDDDAAHGRWNPLAATDQPRVGARGLPRGRCRDPRGPAPGAVRPGGGDRAAARPPAAGARGGAGGRAGGGRGPGEGAGVGPAVGRRPGRLVGSLERRPGRLVRSLGGRPGRTGRSSPEMVTNGPFVPYRPASGDAPSSGTGPPERPLPPWDPARPLGDPEGPDPDDDPDEPDDDPNHDAPPERPSHPPRGLLGGCAAAAGLCCTGQLCCADEFVGPWSGQPRSAWCGTCADGCECGCDCCDCCSDCDGCCDCG